MPPSIFSWSQCKVLISCEPNFATRPTQAGSRERLSTRIILREQSKSTVLPFKLPAMRAANHCQADLKGFHPAAESQSEAQSVNERSRLSRCFNIKPAAPPPGSMEDAPEIPEARANFFSKLVFSWLTPHMVLVRSPGPAIRAERWLIVGMSPRVIVGH